MYIVFELHVWFKFFIYIPSDFDLKKIADWATSWSITNRSRYWPIELLVLFCFNLRGLLDILDILDNFDKVDKVRLLDLLWFHMHSLNSDFFVFIVQMAMNYMLFI